MDADVKKNILKVLLLCIVWYSISSINNVVVKLLLDQFPYPMAVTMCQLSSIVIFTGPLLLFMGVRDNNEVGWNYYKFIIIPLALGKFLASVFSHISMWKVPVSYAHTGR